MSNRNSIHHSIKRIRDIVNNRGVRFAGGVLAFSMVGMPFTSAMICASRVRNDTIMVIPAITTAIMASVSIASSYLLARTFRYIKMGIEWLGTGVEDAFEQQFVSTRRRLESIPIEMVYKGIEIGYCNRACAVEGIECPICYEPIVSDPDVCVELSVDPDGHVTMSLNVITDAEAERQKTGRCKTCSKHMHIDCIGRSMVYAYSNGMVYKCPCCRS